MHTHISHWPSNNPSPEKYVLVLCTSVGVRLSVKSSNQNGMSANGSFSSFLVAFQDSCPSFLVASSSLRSNTESEDELAAALFPEAWDVSGPNDSCDGVVELLSELTDNLGTTRGSKLSVLQIILFPFWSIVALDRWPTHRSIRGLCKACLAIGQLTFLRVVALLRTESWTLVPPRGCALPVCSQYYCWGSGLVTVHNSSELNLFCSSCASEFLSSWYCSPNLTSFLDQGFFMWSFPEFWCARTTLMRRTLLDNTSFPNFDLVPGAFGEIDGVFRSQHSRFT